MFKNILEVAATMPLYTWPNRTGPGVRNYPSRMVGFPANINRHTGKPHEHKREIARNARRAAA